MSKKFLSILAVFGAGLVLLGLAAAFYLSTLFQPANPTNQEVTRFVIPKGQAISIIGNRLAEAGYIKHPLVFRLVVRQQNLANQIQAGSYLLSPSMTPSEIAQTLTTGSEDIWVTIPEGLRREEIAAALTEYELPEYDEQAFLEASVGLEGRLFPETYLIPRDYTAQQIVELMTDTFDTKILNGLEDEIEQSPYEFEEALVMASLVQRESREDEEMKTVAGILWNRIDIGMALQVDATLQYVKGYDPIKKTWWAIPLAADKQLNSPFNTYQNPGLPPKPISNPGLAAIKAALNPASTDYLFYIHDRNGIIRYAEDLDQHNANINRYLR